MKRKFMPQAYNVELNTRFLPQTRLNSDSIDYQTLKERDNTEDTVNIMSAHYFFNQASFVLKRESNLEKVNLLIYGNGYIQQSGLPLSI